MANPSDFTEQAVKVRRALASYDPFRHASDFVDVQPGPDGVEIYGAVRTEAIAHSALHWVRTRVGDVSLVDHLFADNVLEAEVARALAADPRTCDVRIRVGAYFGQVALVGEVPGAAHDSVMEVVQGIPGVRQANASNVPLAPDAQPVATMAPNMMR